MLDPLIVTHSRKCGVVPADKRADEVAWHFDPRGNTSFGSSFNIHPAFLPLTFTSWFVVRLYLAIDLCPQWATDSTNPHHLAITENISATEINIYSMQYNIFPVLSTTIRNVTNINFEKYNDSNTV